MLRVAGIFLGSTLCSLSALKITSMTVGVSLSSPPSCTDDDAFSAVGSPAAGKKKEAWSGYDKHEPRFDGLRFIETLVEV
ncbi:hypothetical protein Taro_033805 [Colocasia esculenta]|uniref:Secreted protein n=1 Tax=Colocasia esculenta TaxID=4460 RepID=A0A843W143_COLES|nr:hypothetical protein [Colocasia esculenta]